jgi:hypothetical protein
MLLGGVIAGCTTAGPLAAPPSSASHDPAGQRSPSNVDPPPHDADEPPAGPPTQQGCEAMPSEGDCHFTLMPTFYCGGPPPPPQLTWPHCSCEPCVTDDHCLRGQRCVGLTTDEECAPLQNVCVDPRKACTTASDCPSPDQACLLVNGRPECRVPTPYPPRP